MNINKDLIKYSLDNHVIRDLNVELDDTVYEISSKVGSTIHLLSTSEPGISNP